MDGNKEEEIKKIGFTDEQINELEKAFLKDKQEWVQADVDDATPYEAYMNLINLIKQTFPPKALDQIIQTIKPGGTLEDSLTPSYIYSLAFEEIKQNFAV